MSLEEREQLEEMGPVDYLIMEWPGGRPSDDVAPMVVDLADRGLIRILDIAFITKDSEGTITTLDLEHLPEGGGAFAAFEGAASGLLDPSDLHDAGAALEPDTSAAVLVWENRWAAPLAVALRRSGGQLIDSGRIPIQALLASLDALETAD